MTHYLRFPDAETGLAALNAAGLLDAVGTPITASHTHAIDVPSLCQTPDTTITAKGTTRYFFSGRPLKVVRGNLVTITGSTPSVTFAISSK